jgi:hypothetical protein
MTVVGKSVCEVAQSNLGAVFGGQSSKAIGPAPRADAASDPDDDKGIVREAIAAVHAAIVRHLF